MIFLLFTLIFLLFSNVKPLKFISAPPTPFNKDGSVNISIIPNQASLLISNKVDGVFVTGTTGESLSLTVSERKTVLDAWIKHKDDLIIIMHVGSESLEEARELAQYSQSVGAHAIGAMPPTFFKPYSVENLAETLAYFANSVELPFYYYHIPSMTGANFKMIDFLPVAMEKIHKFQGIKFTDYNMYDFGLCVQYCKENARCEMLYGHDEVMLLALQSGADGFVGSTYNFFGSFYHDIVDAYYAKNYTGAMELQQRAQLMVQAMLSYRGGVKGIMQLVGVDVGPYRLPLTSMTEEQKKELEETLKKLGFL